MIFTRVTTRSLSNNVLQSLYQNQAKSNDLMQQISTGKKVDSASDDPSAAIDILTANSNLNKLEIYNKNIDNATAEVNTTDTVLSTITDTIQKIKELTVQAANATNGTTELQSINEEIKQLTNTLMDAGNTQFENKYIFAGTSTDTVPFTKDPTTGEILYNGTPSDGNYKRNIEISKGTTIDTNLSGEDVFGYYKITDDTTIPVTVDKKGLFGTLSTLSQALAQDPPNYDAIRSNLDSIDAGLSTVLNASAKIGGISNRLDMTKNKLSNDEINYTKVKSSAEDIDLAKTLSDLTFQQMAYEASLKVSAKIIQPSLLNYM